MIMKVHGYTANGSIDATIEGIRKTVPNNPANRHRQMIAEWEVKGNTIPPYEPPPAPSLLDRPLNRIQFEFMLEKLGITEAIGQAIEAMPETIEAERNEKILARVLFRSGQTFVRDHPLFTQLAPAIGMTPQQIDTAWTEAAQLTW